MKCQSCAAVLYLKVNVLRMWQKSKGNYGLRTLFSGLPLEPNVIVPPCWVLNRASKVRFHSISHISPTPCLVFNTLSLHYIALCVFLCMGESVHTYWEVKSKCWLITSSQSNIFALTENSSLETAPFLFPLNPPSFLYLSLIHPNPHSIVHLHARRTERADRALYVLLWQIEPDCCPHSAFGVGSWWKALIEYTRAVKCSPLTASVTVRRNFFSNDRSRV